MAALRIMMVFSEQARADSPDSEYSKQLPQGHLKVRTPVLPTARALMTTLGETVLLPGHSCEKCQGSLSAVPAACTNDVNAHDDGRVIPVLGEHIQELAPSKLKILTHVFPGVQALNTRL